MSRREDIWSLNSLDPLRSPLRWFERICVEMRFLSNSELPDGYHIDWTPIIGDNQFSYPEISFSTNSQDFKSNFSRVMCPEFVYVALTQDSFARLWKFNHNIIMIKPMDSLNHEPMWLPVTIQGGKYFLVIQYLPRYHQGLYY